MVSVSMKAKPFGGQVGCLRPPRLPPALLIWPGIIRELVERRRLDMAEAVVRQARKAGQELSDDIMASIDWRRHASVEPS